MTKNVLLVGVVLLAGIAVVSRFRPSARAASEVTVLQPIRSFQVQGVDSFRLNDVATYKEDLFLLLKDPSGTNEILRISGTGDILATIPLSSTQTLKHLRISPSGILAVSLPRNGANPTMTIFLYSVDGALKTSFDVPLFNEIAFMGEDVVGVRPNGVVRLTSQSQFAPNAGTLPITLLNPRTPVVTASLPENRLAIVEIVPGALQIVSMNAVLAGPISLNAPEIQGVERPEVENGSVAVVHTVAVSPAGDLYVGVTGHKRQEGVPVLEFDSTGTLKNRIKCILPTFGLDLSDHRSFMSPAKLVTTSQLMFWVSISEKKFAAYPVH